MLPATARDTPFARWDSDAVAAWLHQIGLTAYVSECKRWVRNGDQLLSCTQQELEKEMRMKNPLHRKKLRLALQSVAVAAASGGGGEEAEYGRQPRAAAVYKMSDLDYHWVMRWLDDVGLPQYKDSFSEARVDGRMLHYLTVDDLLTLKVNNSMHHISLKRGIQVLRQQNYNPHCLKRRPVENAPIHNNPSEVMLWTNHRVMEWLRTVDLSEYAPNLRGSGVHGALLVLEPRMTADVLAALLNIPTNKSLLRRHLSTHFTTLIGQDCMRIKREAEASPGYIPLTQTMKLKVKKRTGIIRRKSKSEQDFDEYVCPMDIQGPLGHGSGRNGVKAGGGVQHNGHGSLDDRKNQLHIAEEEEDDSVFQSHNDTLTSNV